MPKLRPDAAIFIGLYILTLILISTNLAGEIISDRYQEYIYFLHTYQTGALKLSADSLVASSVITTYIPAQIARITGINAEWLFKIFPQLFFALTPGYVYLLSRRFLNKRYSLLAAAFIITNFYFLYYAEMGRVGVGFAMMAGLVYAIVRYKMKHAVLFAVLLPLAHYGTYYLMAGILIGTLLVLAVKRKWSDVKWLAVPLAVLLVVGLTWHVGIIRSSFMVSKSVVAAILDLNSDINRSYVTPLQVQASNEKSQTVKPQEQPGLLDGLTNINTRGEVMQVAFGKTLHLMSVPQKIEFAVSWVIVLFLAAAVLYTLKIRRLSSVHSIMIFWVVLMFLVAMIIPAASKQYGIARFYTTACIIVAPCFALLAQRIKPYFPVVVLLLYSLLISGVVHSWFEIVK